jgi:hypothetical protein
MIIVDGAVHTQLYTKMGLKVLGVAISGMLLGHAITYIKQKNAFVDILVMRKTDNVF